MSVPYEISGMATKLPPFLVVKPLNTPVNDIQGTYKAMGVLPLTIVAFLMFALGAILPLELPTNQGSAHLAVYCVACIPITAMAASHDAIRALPRSKYLAFCCLRLTAILLAAYGTRCLLSSPAPFCEQSISKVALLTQAVHYILPRPALWSTGLPLEALPFPEASRGQLWMLCMLCSVMLGISVPDANPPFQLKFLPCISMATEKGEAEKQTKDKENVGMTMAPSAVAFIIGCSLSALWISLSVIASWATTCDGQSI